MKVIELLLPDIRSVYNVGSIFRTAEVLGVKKIWMSGYTPQPVDRFGRKRNDLSKVSLGAEEMIEWEVVENLEEFITEYKKSGVVCALEQSPNSTQLSEFETDKNILLVVGTETTGVASELLSQADYILEIPQVGKKESLNVAVATGIALWSLLQ